MSGIHRRNPEKFYPEPEGRVRTEIHGQDGELIFLDKHPVEIVEAVNQHAVLLKEWEAIIEALSSLYRFVSYRKDLKPDTLWQMEQAKQALTNARTVFDTRKSN